MNIIYQLFMRAGRSVYICTYILIIFYSVENWVDSCLQQEEDNIRLLSHANGAAVPTGRVCGSSFRTDIIE